ncbi:MAG: hypothetical protein ACPL1F_08240, partial [bacterium]
RFKKEDKKNQRNYILQDQRFNIDILFYPRVNDEDIKKFLSVLFVAFNLGNFGARSRRGFGSILIEKIEGDLPNNFNLKFTPEIPIDKWLLSQLDYIRNLNFWKPRKDIPYIFDNNFQIYKINKENISKYKEWVKEVQEGRRGNYLKKEWGLEDIKNQIDLLDYMGFLLMAFRSYRNPDYQSAKNILKNQDNNNLNNNLIEFQRISFGLPINFFFSSLRNSGELFLKKDNQKFRRASPLIFKILEINNSDFPFEALFIILLSKFMPDNSKLYFKNKEIKFSQKDSFQLLKNFIQSLQKYEIINKIK